MNLSEKLIKYYSTGDSEILGHKGQYEKSDYNILCIFLFEWLKLEHKRFLWKQDGRPACSKPLKLDQAATFTRIIPDFIENDEVFRHSLKIDGDKLYFSEEMSEEEIRTITKMAFDYYNPERHY